jgi:hypothetical protein
MLLPIINFDVIPVNVNMLHSVIEHSARIGIPRVARHIVGYHKNYVTVWYAQPFHASTNTENIGHVPVVEPKPRSVD